VRQWWLAACLPLLVTACAPRRAPAPAQAGAGQRQAQPKKEITSTPPASPARIPALPPVSTEQALLALSSPRLVPEDFEIGPLADLLAGSRAQRLAAAAGLRFLASLASGKVADGELAPDRREELTHSLQHYLDRKLTPSRSRLGPLVEVEGGVLRARVHLFGEPGEALGELYFSQEGGQWYVSDVQIGLASLGVPHPRSSEKFIPTEAP
jgi:hypothetical protein